MDGIDASRGAVFYTAGVFYYFRTEDVKALFRKLAKTKSVFPTDDSLFKMLYLAMMDITKKWTGRRQDWSTIYAQLVVFFGDRIPE